MAELPHIRFPFARDPVTGKVIVVEQDTGDHVMSCENVIAACPAGWRQERPEFGWQPPTFRNVPVSPQQLQAALESFEPRSTADATEYAAAADAALRRISVDVGVSDG